MPHYWHWWLRVSFLYVASVKYTMIWLLQYSRCRILYIANWQMHVRLNAIQQSEIALWSHSCLIAPVNIVSASPVIADLERFLAICSCSQCRYVTSVPGTDIYQHEKCAARHRTIAVLEHGHEKERVLEPLAEMAINMWCFFLILLETLIMDTRCEYLQFMFFIEEIRTNNILITEILL